MADSNITKRALAGALRELMNEMPFEKISVADICQRCDMNRKSFYYHFKDKYDLVNWIFDTEFITLAMDEAMQLPYEDRFRFFETAGQYFYENRDFYRKALKIKGQNSFADHFREYIQPILRDRLTTIFGSADADAFMLDFFTGAVVSAMESWLSSRDCIPPEELVAKMRRILETGAVLVQQEMEQTAKEDG